MKKIFNFALILTLCLSLVACSNGDEGNDKIITYMVCAKQAVENYLSNVSYSSDTDDWTITKLDDGNTSIVTKGTLSGESEKTLINVIIKLGDDGEKFETYFVEVGGNVYLDTLPEDY